MAQDHIWAPLAEGQPTHHREPGQMIYLTGHGGRAVLLYPHRNGEVLYQLSRRG